MVLFIGLEGGGSSSKALILDKNGKILSYTEGLHTSQTLVDVVVAADRIASIISSCLKKINLPEDSRINYLGLSLSGIDTPEAEKMCRDAIVARWTSGIDHLVICNDTVGSLRTADNAGIVLIAGTGSNCRLIHKDLNFHRVGGWGYMLGDEGSAYWIVTTGIKRLIDHEEGLIPEELPVVSFRQIVFKYFHIDNIHDLIQVYYKNFDKAHVAKMCIIVAKCAKDEQDRFCLSLFEKAGYFLGRKVSTMARHCKDILQHEGGLPVVCVGGVWASWDLLKNGFLDGLKPKYPMDVPIKSICLKRLKITAAYGAAVIASEMGSDHLHPDYANTSEIFFQSQNLE